MDVGIEQHTRVPHRGSDDRQSPTPAEADPTGEINP